MIKPFISFRDYLPTAAGQMDSGTQRLFFSLNSKTKEK